MRRTGVLIAVFTAALCAFAPAALAKSPAWRTYKVAGAPQFNGVRCPSTSLCVAMTHTGAIYTTSNASAAQPTWKQTAGLKVMGPKDYGPYSEQPLVFNLSCPSTQLCVTTDKTKIVTTTDPTGPASGWKAVDLKPQLDLQGEVDAISCPKTTLCVGAINESGNEPGDGTSLAFASTADPTGDASAWKVTPTDITDFMVMLACAPSGVCAGGDSYTGMFGTPNGLDSSTWIKTGSLSNEMQYLTCPSAKLCVGSDIKGRLLRSTAPTKKGSWRANPVAGGAFLGAVSCSSTSFCVGGAVTKRVDTGLASGNPGALASWRLRGFSGYGKAQLHGIACRPGGFCVAVGDQGLVAVRR